MRSVGELIRGMVAVLATMLVIIALIGFSTGVADPTAILRSTLAATIGIATVAYLLGSERRRASTRKATISHR